MSHLCQSWMMYISNQKFDTCLCSFIYKWQTRWIAQVQARRCVCVQMGSSTSAKWFTLRRQARWASWSGERLAVRADVRAVLQEPYAPHRVTRAVVCQNCTAGCMWGNRESWSTAGVMAHIHEHTVPVNMIPPNNKAPNVLHSNCCSTGVSKYLDDGNKTAAVYEPHTHILLFLPSPEHPGPRLFLLLLWPSERV